MSPARWDDPTRSTHRTHRPLPRSYVTHICATYLVVLVASLLWYVCTGGMP